ncbi:MAG: hypothetical protein QNJ87_08160 [Gammaproteobacteria bacterium]|nr:hypothetical protein [Gammaproteobacteria bacterium]MDJ0871729.1 hypothetical protein [Gammaproteobacteria bacterium]MDJ0890556.1 hypothetical protein [Gammaproteobacteria bacterium]
MQLDIYIGNSVRQLDVESGLLEEGEGFFAKMDRDMDAGWKMGPDFVERPDRLQRGQIAASRLLVAIETGNDTMVQAMAGYIASRLPEVRSINIDVNGEPLNTEMVTNAGQSVKA